MLKIYNSLTEKLENFIPIDEKNVRMYVCGPTVYSRPHLGNARSSIIYDVLYRVLKILYPKVTYVRNITDVDDKIINTAKEKNVYPEEIAKKVENEFHEDLSALFCLNPDHEPHATEYIYEMESMISELIEKNFAYISQNHVLFDVKKCQNYGCLSKKNTNELIAGSRIEIESYKKNPLDFVLWKPADKTKNQYGFESKFGYGKPGWHIECSAMSKKLLGDEFDIHGGGADLKFPHHDNEIAQSTCSSGKNFAKYWIHNGFLLVNGEKMSKSLGNFVTPRDLINTGHHPEVIRFALLQTSYSKPMDFTDKLLQDSKISLEKFYQVIQKNNYNKSLMDNISEMEAKKDIDLISPLLENLNTTKFIATMHVLVNSTNIDIQNFIKIGKMIGIFNQSADEFFAYYEKSKKEIPNEIIKLAEERSQAKIEKNFQKADEIKRKIQSMGYEVTDLTGSKFEIEEIS